MGTEQPVKVGDKLAFRCGNFTKRWEIHEVTKITPSGRIQCGSWTLNPDLTIRGRSGYHGPYRGEILTPERQEQITGEITRRKCLACLNNTAWESLPEEVALKIWQLVKLSTKDSDNGHQSGS